MDCFDRLVRIWVQGDRERLLVLLLHEVLDIVLRLNSQELLVRWTQLLPEMAIRGTLYVIQNAVLHIGLRVELLIWQR